MTSRVLIALLFVLVTEVAFAQETPEIPTSTKSPVFITILQEDLDNLIEHAVNERICMARLMTCAQAFGELHEEYQIMKDNGFCRPPNPWKNGPNTTKIQWLKAVITTYLWKN